MTPIAGQSVIGPDGLAAFMAARVPRPVPGLAATISLAAYTFGIRAEVMLAQQVHETGWYEFPRCGQDGFAGCRDFNNYAGIKTTDSTAIAKFSTPLLGCVAQAAHLAWYGLPQHVNAFCAQPFDPRHFGDHRWSAPDVTMLGGKWAPDPAYGGALQALLDEIMAFEAKRLAALRLPST